jgi:hypothetical protein
MHRADARKHGTHDGEFEDMRRLCLSLPEADEHARFGQPDFRVRGKIFAGRSARAKRAPKPSSVRAASKGTR